MYSLAESQEEVASEGSVTATSSAATARLGDRAGRTRTQPLHGDVGGLHAGPGNDVALGGPEGYRREARNSSIPSADPHAPYGISGDCYPTAASLRRRSSGIPIYLPAVMDATSGRWDSIAQRQESVLSRLGGYQSTTDRSPTGRWFKQLSEWGTAYLTFLTEAAKYGYAIGRRCSTALKSAQQRSGRSFLAQAYAQYVLALNNMWPTGRRRTG